MHPSVARCRSWTRESSLQTCANVRKHPPLDQNKQKIISVTSWVQVQEASSWTRLVASLELSQSCGQACRPSTPSRAVHVPATCANINRLSLPPFEAWCSLNGRPSTVGVPLHVSCVYGRRKGMLVTNLEEAAHPLALVQPAVVWTDRQAGTNYFSIPPGPVRQKGLARRPKIDGAVAPDVIKLERLV